jgi:hypothetical protein
MPSDVPTREAGTDPKEKGTLMRQSTVNIHSGHKGDVVVISGHHVGEPERLGEILEVLGEADHSHYRVRWDDGSESVFYPGSDASIRPAHQSGPARRSP